LPLRLIGLIIKQVAGKRQRSGDVISSSRGTGER
jgi:hypothetical protein